MAGVVAVASTVAAEEAVSTAVVAVASTVAEATAAVMVVAIEVEHTVADTGEVTVTPGIVIRCRLLDVPIQLADAPGILTGRLIAAETLTMPAVAGAHLPQRAIAAPQCHTSDAAAALTV
ncbi:MAG: hypothetical protein WB630_00300 [Candidatus Acidiferrales bacterium]